MSDTLMVTDHAQFYRVNPGDGEDTVFYPADGPTSRDLARKADAGGDPPIVGGFAVYDTNVSTAYAVALYATKAEAEAHAPGQPEQAPADVFTGTGGNPNETEATPANAAEPTEDTDKTVTTTSGASRTTKRKGKRK